jgi:hypothetical protein
VEQNACASDVQLIMNGGQHGSVHPIPKR